MSKEQKIEWLSKATNEELLHQLESFIGRATVESFGSLTYREDIELTREEILKRMK